VAQIRVLRILEYIYETPERAASDRLHWRESHRDGGMSMRSATLPMEVVKFVEVSDND